jgi:hypothetical protein
MLQLQAYETAQLLVGNEFKASTGWIDSHETKESLVMKNNLTVPQTT